MRVIRFGIFNVPHPEQAKSVEGPTSSVRAETARSVPLPERRHYVLSEPAELLLELLGRDALGPVNHEVLEARVLCLDRFDALDHKLGRAAEPGLLLDAVLEARRARGRARGAPGAALLVGVAHEAEGREPFVALVVRGLDPADRFLLGIGEIDAGAPDHVLAELLRAPVAVAGVVVGAHDVVQDLLAVQGHHRLEAVARHHVDGLAAGDRHPNLDRQMLWPRDHRDLLELIAAVRHWRRALEVLALVMERLLVEAFEEQLQPLLEIFAIGLRIEERRAEALDAEA